MTWKAASAWTLLLLLAAATCGPGATLLTVEEANAVVGGCQLGFCEHWGYCHLKYCYAPGRCEGCTTGATSVEEKWPRFPGYGYPLVYQIVDDMCGHRAPYGECIGYDDPPGTPGVCYPGIENQLDCPGKFCIEYVQ